MWRPCNVACVDIQLCICRLMYMCVCVLFLDMYVHVCVVCRYVCWLVCMCVLCVDMYAG